jgi:hypothetical protein
MFYKSNRIATTATQTYTNVYVVKARLKAGAAAATLTLYNSTTAATDKIAMLGAVASAADELRVPVRVKSGTLKAVLTPNTAEAFILVG